MFDLDLETEEGLLTLKVLEAMSDAHEAGEKRVSVHFIYEQLGTDEFEGAHWLVKAHERGWVRDCGSLAALQELGSNGRPLVQQARSVREDRGMRRAACRRQVLRWVDNSVSGTTAQVDTSKFNLSALSWFYGSQFTLEEIDDALGFLKSKNLVHGIGAWGATLIKVGITHDGQECMTDAGGEVAAWLAAKESKGPSFRVSGSGNSFAVATAPGSSATSTISGIDLAQVAMLVAAIRQAEPLLQLSDEGRAALDDIDQVEDEGRLRRGLGWFGGLATDTSAGALGNLLGAFVAGMLGMTF